MSDPRTIATLRKNNAEEIRVRVAEHDGYTLVDLRVFSASRRNHGEPQPTRAGICVVRERLPELIQALQAAQREAAR
ncbi:hypothetical protein ABIE45_000352 [Methylobacterium sp. OAE515]|uniref:hypothetical protein n=1 Tax=Methylobacterium sp. OAE515 TaxID=2817895 RepID=UPI00178AD8F0